MTSVVFSSLALRHARQSNIPWSPASAEYVRMSRDSVVFPDTSSSRATPRALPWKSLCGNSAETARICRWSSPSDRGSFAKRASRAVIAFLPPEGLEAWAVLPRAVICSPASQGWVEKSIPSSPSHCRAARATASPSSP